LPATLELGRARVRNERDDVVKDRREAFAMLILKPIDEAGSRIIALVVAAMLQRWRVGGERVKRSCRGFRNFEISAEGAYELILHGKAWALSAS